MKRFQSTASLDLRLGNLHKYHPLNHLERTPILSIQFRTSTVERRS